MMDEGIQGVNKRLMIFENEFLDKTSESVYYKGDKRQGAPLTLAFVI